jgi:hypothetical protein
VEDLDTTSRLGDVEPEIERPHMIRMLGSQLVGRHPGVTAALALAALDPHTQALFPPDTLNLLAVVGMSLASQNGVRTPIAPAGMLLGEAPQPLAQVPVRIRLDRFVALCGAMLSDDLACPPLREAEAVGEHDHRSPPPRRAHQFPRLISRRAVITSSLSATIRFNVTFSRSSSLSRFASSAFIPPYCLRQR